MPYTPKSGRDDDSWFPPYSCRWERSIPYSVEDDPFKAAHIELLCQKLGLHSSKDKDNKVRTENHAKTHV
jgi:hypothetical protein